MHTSFRKAGLRELLSLLLRQRKRYYVEGHSLEPLLAKGSAVLAKKLTRDEELASGDCVIFQHPFERSTLLIKQIKWIKPAGVYVSGICSESCDSRSFGLIPQTAVLAKVTSLLI